MAGFDYIAVIISVIIGLGLSHLLSGTTELFKARKRVKFYWVHFVWILLIFIGHIFLWWTMWNLRLVRNWNFFSFLVLLLAPVLLYVAAALLIPKVDDDSRIDLQEYFVENQTAFFSADAAFTVLLWLENLLLAGRLPPGRVTIAFGVWFVLLCLSAVIKSRLYQAFIALLFTLLFIAFIFLFGLRLGGT